MQTTLADFIRDTPDGDEADAILRKCVHCGFCTATCPTYQLLGDELDGPRGRIYLIKQMVEGQAVTRRTQVHLDRCLSCRSCETTCPSGVQYGRLLEIGRKHVEQQVVRPWRERVLRAALARVLPQPGLFGALLRLGQAVRPWLPRPVRDKVPRRQPAGAWPQRTHARKMLMLAGCVQPAMSPNINRATARVLDALGVQAIVPAAAGCCGAIRLHLSEQEAALDDMRRNIDAWWPHVEQGVEAIVMNASGCGATVKEYAHLLRDDAAYAHKAQRIVALTRDLAEILPEFGAQLALLLAPRHAPRQAAAQATDSARTALGNSPAPRARGKRSAAARALDATTVAFHSPCTLQHGQQVRGKVENLLTALGIAVKVPADAHLCCGSAGTYSISQPQLSRQLRTNKLNALHALKTELIVSANVGCICHMQAASATPVMHWVELIDARLTACGA
jgi:glycolate oxidase iron-sulfur subunit